MRLNKKTQNISVIKRTHSTMLYAVNRINTLWNQPFPQEIELMGDRTSAMFESRSAFFIRN